MRGVKAVLKFWDKNDVIFLCIFSNVARFTGRTFGASNVCDSYAYDNIMSTNFNYNIGTC